MKMSKKLLSLLLCAIMVLGSAAIGGGGFAEVLDAFSVKASAIPIASCKKGDIIEFGTYPQGEVTDSALVSALNGAGGSWKSYGYYSGTGDSVDGRMKPSDYMRYKDVSYNGSKYRAVTFDSYRPFLTGAAHADGTYQDDNGYTTGNVYWFKYEPIKWRVLDPSMGLIMCDTAIDSQAYNNYMWNGVGSLNSSSKYYGDEAHTYYASNYAESSIRAWLNKDFYDTAFSSEQKSSIIATTLDNSSTRLSAYDAPSTTDKIFLLSYSDSINSNYGFSSSDSACDTARQLKSTDYAKCQGCYQETSDSYWWLRSPGYTNDARVIWYDGISSLYNYVNYTHVGVVPALRLNLSSDIIQTGTATGSGTGSDDGWADSTHIRFGSYPQTDVTASMGETLDAKATGWKSYKYYSGTDDWDDGQMSSADYMMYCDVTVMNGSVSEKYRGVKFNTYRPCWTGYASTTSASNTYQYDNGYTYGKTYWFKYEPLVWRVLDSSTGLVMCESIIDSQAYNNYIWYGVGSKSTSSEYYGNKTHTNYANDYYNSSIRKWLTEDFYATAFSKSQQNKLLKYDCDNSCYSSSYPEYDSQNSSDKVFLLSYDEVKTAAYGFNSIGPNYDPARRAKGTDYAKCQGLSVHYGNSCWWLRSPDSDSRGACGVNGDGYSDYNYNVGDTRRGVRPALKLNLLEIMKAEAKAELAEAKKNAVSDEAKAAIDTAIKNVDKATNLDAVASAKAEGTRNAENADNAYAEKIKFDNVNIKVAGAQTVDYRSIVTITATAAGVPDDCKLVLYVNGTEVKTGDNKSVSYEYGEIKSDINYTVKVIDANGKVQKDSNGNELTKDGGKISCNAGFFQKLIAFFKGLFNSLPKVEVKP